MSAPTWPAMHGPTPAAGVRQRQIELGRRGGHRLVGGERERRLAERGRVDAEHDVVHDRVADHHHFEHPIAVDADLFDQFADQLVERPTDRVGQLAIAAGVHHHVRHPAHQVFAELDLRVHPAGARQHLAGGDVAQVPGDRGRTDVDGDAEGGIDETGPHSDHLLPLVDRDRDGAVATVDRRLQRGEHRERRRRTRAAVLHRNRRGERAGCRRLVAELGLRHLDIAERERRVDDDRWQVEVLANDLTMTWLAAGMSTTTSPTTVAAHPSRWCSINGRFPR